MWAALLRLLSIASLTTLINNFHDWLQKQFGNSESGKWLPSPFVLLLIAAAIVLFIYKVLGKKIIIR